MRETTNQRYKSIRSGLSAASKYPDRPMREYVEMSLKERAIRHQTLHPNDKNTKKTDKSIQWAKSKKSNRDKKLSEFYKTHVYTWVSETQRAWVRVAKNDGVGEEE